MDLFIRSATTYFNSKERHDLADLFEPLSQSYEQEELKANLRNFHNFRTTTLVDKINHMTSNTQFSEFLARYLLFVREADWEGEAVKACELMVAVYKAATSVFQQLELGWFGQTMRKLTEPLVELSFWADKENGDPKMTITNQNVPLLNRALQLACNERNPDPKFVSLKKEAAFSIANGLFRISFRIDNLVLCDTVIGSARNAYDILDTHHIVKAERVKYYYYLGRLALYQRNLRKASMNLRKAFDLCVDPEHNVQRQQILIYLIPTCLLIGLTFNAECLAMFQLDEQYAQLFTAVKRGDYKSALKEIENWRTWHARNKTYLILKEKLEIICWRNLTRKVVTLMDPEHTINRLEFCHLVAPANEFIDPENSLDINDVECMLAVLIDQGYIKAYIHHKNRLLVLQKGPQFGFPSLSSVRSVVVAD